MKQELWLIWKNPKDRRRHTIGILNCYYPKYVFHYRQDIIRTIKEEFDYFPGFEDITKRYESEGLFTNIKSRLPNPTRPDYEEILASYKLNKESTDMEILEKTRGRLLTDDFEFVPYFNKENIEFDVAGISHCEDLKKCKEKLKIGDTLQLEREENNLEDSNAIKVIYGEQEKYKIGYVPRYYSEELTAELKKNRNYHAEISNLNCEAKFSDEMIRARVRLEF